MVIGSFGVLLKWVGVANSSRVATIIVDGGGGDMYGVLIVMCAVDGGW